jgi:DNA polymerase-3 subunit delta'
MLFTGIDGIGKRKTAVALGMALNCLRPVGVSACGACISCQKVVSGSHPDIITVRPEGAFIKIDQVRSVSRELRFAPLEGNRRVVIMDDAQAMNLEASNAMLKILEEPPEHTILILTASQTTDLLPTIVSRCQQIAFRPLPYEKIAGVLMDQRGLEREAATTLALATKGSLGNALSVDVDGWSVWRSRLLEEISAVSMSSIQPVLAFADALSRDKDGLADALDMLMTWFRDILMHKISPDRIVNKDLMDEIERASKGRSVSELLGKVEFVKSAQTAIARNANPRLALEVMTLRLCSQDQAKFK